MLLKVHNGKTDKFLDFIAHNCYNKHIVDIYVYMLQWATYIHFLFYTKGEIFMKPLNKILLSMVLTLTGIAAFSLKVKAEEIFTIPETMTITLGTDSSISVDTAAVQQAIDNFDFSKYTYTNYTLYYGWQQKLDLAKLKEMQSLTAEEYIDVVIDLEDNSSFVSSEWINPWEGYLLHSTTTLDNDAVTLSLGKNLVDGCKANAPVRFVLFVNLYNNSSDPTNSILIGTSNECLIRKDDSWPSVTRGTFLTQPKSDLEACTVTNETDPGVCENTFKIDTYINPYVDTNLELADFYLTTGNYYGESGTVLIDSDHWEWNWKDNTKKDEVEFKIYETIAGKQTYYLTAHFRETIDTTLYERFTKSNPFNVIWKAKLESIEEPTALTGVKNGAEKTVDALGLPATVVLNLNDSTTRNASVMWDVDSCSYNPAKKTEQTFLVDGIVTLPEDVDADGKDLKVKIEVTVKGAQVSTPIANYETGEYTKDLSVSLSCATEDVEIYYTLDGTTPTKSSTKYDTTIKVCGTHGVSIPYTLKAIALKTDWENSSIATYTYTISLPTQYSITVNSDSNGTASANVSKAAAGDTVTLTVSGNSGYIFSSWTSSGTSVTIKNNKFTMPAGNVVLKANFKKASTYTVRFVMNGHGSSIDPKYVQEGSTVSKPSDPSASGYTFGGWYTDSSLSSKYDFDNKVTSNLTLYAKWTSASSSTSTSTTTYYGKTSSTSNTTANFVYQQSLAERTVMCSIDGSNGATLDLKGYGTDPKNITNQYALANAYMAQLFDMDAACFDTADLYPTRCPLGNSDGTNQMLIWKGTKCPAGTVYGVVYNLTDKAYIIPGVCDSKGTVTFPNFKLRSQSTMTLCIPITRAATAVTEQPIKKNGETKTETTTETVETTTTSAGTTTPTASSKTVTKTIETTPSNKSKSFSTTL